MTPWYGLVPFSWTDPYYESLLNRFSCYELVWETLIVRVRSDWQTTRTPTLLRYEPFGLFHEAGKSKVWNCWGDRVLWQIWHTICGPERHMLHFRAPDCVPDFLWKLTMYQEEEDASNEEDDVEDALPTQVTWPLPQRVTLCNWFGDCQRRSPFKLRLVEGIFSGLAWLGDGMKTLLSTTRLALV